MALSITTWNCGGISFTSRKTKIQYFQNFIKSDIVCLQNTHFVPIGCLGFNSQSETLCSAPGCHKCHPIHHDFVDRLHLNYHGTARSFEWDDSHGDHFGGVAILWKKGLDENVTDLDPEDYMRLQDGNLCGIKLTLNGERTLILCCLVPQERYKSREARYQRVRDIVETFGRDRRYQNIILCGDLNVYPGEMGFSHLIQQCHTSDVCMADVYSLGERQVATFLDELWSDHFIVSSYVADSSHFHVGNETPSEGGHYPVTMTIDQFTEPGVGTLAALAGTGNEHGFWRRYKSKQLERYEFKDKIWQQSRLLWTGSMTGKFHEDMTNSFLVPWEILTEKAPSGCVVYQAQLASAENSVLKLDWHLRLESYVEKQRLLVRLLPVRVRGSGNSMEELESFKCTALFQLGKQPEFDSEEFSALRQSINMGKVTSGVKPWVISIPDLCQLKEELYPGGATVLRVTVRTGYNPEGLTLKVSDRIKEIQDKDIKYPIQCRSNEEKMVGVHREVLAGRSFCLRELTSCGRAIVVPFDDYETLRIFGHYLYQGVIPTFLTSVQLSDLIRTAHKFGLTELKEFCFRHLAFTMKDEMAVEAVILAHDYEAGEEVTKIIETFIKRKFSTLSALQ